MKKKEETQSAGNKMIASLHIGILKFSMKTTRRKRGLNMKIFPMKPLLFLFFLCALYHYPATAQTWHATLLPPVNMADFGVAAGNYSAITWIGGNRYALVSDKERTDGFFPLNIELDTLTGAVRHVRRDTLRGNPHPRLDAAALSVRDCEGMAWQPSSSTFFLSGEGDQRILEYDTLGHPTGRELAVPKEFAIENIAPNYGFEALTYDTLHGLFWTTTESTLRADGVPAQPSNGRPNLLRVQAFNDSLQPVAQYAYRTDTPQTAKDTPTYAFGVSALAALPSGQLLVLEREFRVPDGHIGSTVHVKIYVADPRKAMKINAQTNLSTLAEADFMPKTLLASFSTKLKMLKMNLANYEGMCLGPTLADGRQTLLLVSDSQGGYGNSLFHLKDYLRIILLREE